ncbi:sigma-54-dependent transcriptional regulator [Acidaminobacter hydrogenoformans]|uniref:Stage 0 sporulation protein A homolog n=1 Tax=Acidaminobacter hydrogenoformans DSM 2784 TaxID=1120920 RepID=A0A1G5S1A4_9FIRM|nr:sigma-54 dependent transcriptional regulator [Acidaminobacter hydrogenoformans]SCZ79700.1 regulatory protein, Fis family [Acidaminobacter hydrogenoformans DSM 2784]
MKILILDDEKGIRMSLKISLSAMGYTVFEAEDGEAALELISKEALEIAILDINLPGISGLEVLKHLRRVQPECRVIMMTYLSEVKLAVQAMKLGAFDYFTKPFALKEMNALVQSMAQYVVSESANFKDKSIADGHESQLIGNSEAIRKIREIIAKIRTLQHHTCILISGESGTGKEIVARAIQGGGSDKPFIAINCSAIPSTLQESEFFGYEKGAFSEAKAQKKGLIEYADGGVLFLDEIGDMDPGLQAKLLRVLQEKKFRRLGGVTELSFDATVVAATNRNLMDDIEAGRFRKDLFYRLNVVPIELPPLRERQGDIPLLVMHFVGQFNQRLGMKVTGVSAVAMSGLMAYDWPGNVRELKNMIERIMIFMDSGEIELADLPSEILETSDVKEDEDGLIDAASRSVIMKTLSNTNWNISQAAKALGISRLTLRRRIERYGLINPNKSGKD